MAFKAILPRARENTYMEILSGDREVTWSLLRALPKDA